MCVGVLELLCLSQGKECIEKADPRASLFKNQHPSIPSLLPHPGDNRGVYLEEFSPDEGQPRENPHPTLIYMNSRMCSSHT